MNQRYIKKEHLKGKKQIEILFSKGSWCSKYPLKVVYLPNSFKEMNHKVGVSVSKKKFKKAVDRNYIKRLLRECYRLHKRELGKTFSESHLLMIIYNSKEKFSLAELERKYLQLLEKIKFREDKENSL